MPENENLPMLLISFGFFVLGAISTFQSIKISLKIKSSLNWPFVYGKILSVGFLLAYRSMKYFYTINGKNYVSSEITFEGDDSFIMKHYLEVKDITIYYDPKNFKESIVMRESQRKYSFYLGIISAILFGLGVISLFFVFKK